MLDGSAEVCKEAPMHVFLDQLIPGLGAIEGNIRFHARNDDVLPCVIVVRPPVAFRSQEDGVLDVELPVLEDGWASRAGKYEDVIAPIGFVEVGEASANVAQSFQVQVVCLVKTVLAAFLPEHFVAPKETFAVDGHEEEVCLVCVLRSNLIPEQHLMKEHFRTVLVGRAPLILGRSLVSAISHAILAGLEHSICCWVLFGTHRHQLGEDSATALTLVLSSPAPVPETERGTRRPGTRGNRCHASPHRLAIRPTTARRWAGRICLGFGASPSCSPVGLLFRHSSIVSVGPPPEDVPGPCRSPGPQSA
eukprot:scaffold2560_cov397-Prasinococcus_capsulatus_cf.AAC.8